MHQTLDSSDVFGYLHGSVSTASEPVTQEGLQPQATGNWEQDISSPGSSSSLLARVSRKRLKMDPAVAHDDDCVMVAMSGNISMGSPISRNSAILLHEFHITEESNVPGRGQRGKKAAAKGKRRHCGPSIASLFFEKGIPEPGGENENWYRGLGQSQGIAALKDALQSANLEEMLSALGPCSEPSGGQWRQLQLPLAATLDVHAGSQPLGWWLVRPDLPSFDSTNSVTARLFISPDEAVKCLTASPDVERRGVEMSPFRQAFEWRVVGGPAIRKRKRKVDRANFKLQIQGNRQDPCANQPPHFQDFPLRKEQLRSLWWMQQQEKTDQVFDLTLCRVRVDPMKPATPIPPGSIRSPQFRELNWQLELARRAFYKVRGGILGDAPGYGKTATTIGLIDSSLAERPTIPSDQQPYFFHSFASLVLVPSNLLDQWVDEIQKFTKHSSASPALSMSRTSGMPLKVLAIKTVAHLKALTVEEICHAAIVICSYRLLYSKVYRARLLELAGTAGLTSGCFERSPETKKSTPDAAALRGPVDLLNLRRNTRRFRENPASLMWDHRQELPCEAPMSEIKDSSQLAFPVLEQIWWKRVVLDEFHELEAIGDTAQFESLQGICAHYRWGLTGTPPTRDLAQVATLAKVFHLGELPRADETCAYSTELAQEMAQHFLDHFARQNTSEEVEPIPLKERIITVDQTAEERAIYLQASRDVADNSGSALSEEDRAERLIKLCSHFAAYCGMAAAASDAGSECHRIISTKEDHAKKTRKEVLQRAVQLELLWQTVGSVGSRSSDQQEILQQLGADPAECAGLMHLTRPMPQVPLPEVGNKQQTPAAQIAETLEEESRQAPKDPASMEPVPPPEEASENSACQVHQETHRNDPAVLNSYSSSASLAAAAFTEASRMSLPQLQRLAGPRFSGHENGQSIATAQGRMVSAAQTALSAQRSVEFFKRTLAAARGDSSADQRSCSICLEEDLKEEQLSITVCAHVFHTDCLKEVVQHFKTCPVCRHSLEGKNKVTPLTLELAPDLRAERGKKRGPGDDTAKKAGSKLVALATHLQGIAPGEKVLVFCQWEDLKKHIAETLQTMGVPHLQLSGSIYQRSDILRRFQDETQDGARVLLLSLEHAASGTNLTAANHVVFVHPMHATSAERAVAYEAQAIARCRRYGQEKTVHCWRFVSKGTIEETITSTHQRDLWEDHVREDSKKRQRAPSASGGG